MKRYFKSRKVKKINYLFWFMIFIASIFISTKLINIFSYDYIIDGNLDNIFNITIDKDKILLKMGLNYENSNEVSKDVFKEINYISDKVYIYNTHQSEEYVDFDVYHAGKLLKEKLEEYGIETIIEETNIKSELDANGYSYNDSYKITRNLLNNIMSDDINLYIDLHRDSSNKDITTITYDGISYARVMFVVGGKHENYLKNYTTSDNLNKMIQNYNVSLSRGIYVRKSSSYNQDLGSNIVLIELGGPYNTEEEVSNTINVLAEAIKNYISE